MARNISVVFCKTEAGFINMDLVKRVDTEHEAWVLHFVDGTELAVKEYAQIEQFLDFSSLSGM